MLSNSVTLAVFGSVLLLAVRLVEGDLVCSGASRATCHCTRKEETCCSAPGSYTCEWCCDEGHKCGDLSEGEDHCRPTAAAIVAAIVTPIVVVCICVGVGVALALYWRNRRLARLTQSGAIHVTPAPKTGGYPPVTSPEGQLMYPIYAADGRPLYPINNATGVPLVPAGIPLGVDGQPQWPPPDNIPVVTAVPVQVLPPAGCEAPPNVPHPSAPPVHQVHNAV